MPLFTSEELSEAARRSEASDIDAPRVIAGRSSVAPDADVERLLRIGRSVRIATGLVDLAAIGVAVVMASFWPLAAIVLSHIGATVVSEAAASRVRRARQKAHA